MKAEDKECPVDPARRANFYALLLKKTVDLIAQSRCYLAHAPRHERYAMCSEIKKQQLLVYTLVVEAKKRYWNKTTLTKLDVAHEVLRSLWALYYQLGYFHYKDGVNQCTDVQALKRFTVINIQINEIGAMLGGLIKSARASEFKGDDKLKAHG